MASERVRIYDLAKQLDLTNKQVMNLIEEKLGIKAKSHASTISKEEADKIEQMSQAKTAPTPAAEKKPAPSKEPEAPIQKTEEKPVQPFEKKEVQPVKKSLPQTTRGDQRPGGKPEGGYRPRGEQRPGGRPEGEFRPRGDQRPGGRPEGEFRPRGDQRPGGRPEGGYRPRGDQRPGGRSEGGYRPRGDQRPGGRPEGGYRPGGDQRPGGKPEGGFRPRGDQRPGGRPGFKPAATAVPQPQSVDGRDKTPVKKDFTKKKDKYRDKEEEKLEKLQEQKVIAANLQKKKKSKADEVEEKVTEIILDAPLTVAELSSKMKLSVAEVIKELMMSGVMATVNQTVDIETAKQVAEKLEFAVIVEETKAKEDAAKKPEDKPVIDESRLVERAPVVTIMGHVDHGKTTLLDAIRKSRHKIVSTEVGGITQSIGAYTAEIGDKRIVFIDTPGHEAFTSMRARGARVTDIVILVVAADDGIMPQTIEAINHAKAAKVPIIVAVNKIDKEGCDPDRVLQQLTEHELVPEKWGGDTITVPVSALQGTNLDELLEYIILVSEIEELKADPVRLATGVIIESRLDKGKGAVATFLVQQGTLKVGDFVVAGKVGGKVRALIDDTGKRVKSARPSTPVEILGLSEVPEAGDAFDAVASDREMKETINKRQADERMSKLEAMAPSQVRREMLLQGMEGETKELNIIIKAATHGAAEAVSASLQQLESKKIFVKVVHLAVGDISEADVMLAKASNAVIVGFGVKEDANAIKIASEDGISIRIYDIIYQMLDDIEQTMLGLLEPEYKEVEIGTVEIRQVFTVGKTNRIAGCYVLDGKVIRNKEGRLIREGKEIFRGSISQLKRFKDDVKEVASGYECGISFDKFNDIQEGDIIKVITQEEVERHTLV